MVISGSKAAGFSDALYPDMVRVAKERGVPPPSLQFAPFFLMEKSDEMQMLTAGTGAQILRVIASLA